MVAAKGSLCEEGTQSGNHSACRRVVLEQQFEIEFLKDLRNGTIST